MARIIQHGMPTPWRASAHVISSGTSGLVCRGCGLSGFGLDRSACLGGTAFGWTVGNSGTTAGGGGTASNLGGSGHTGDGAIVGASSGTGSIAAGLDCGSGKRTTHRFQLGTLSHTHALTSAALVSAIAAAGKNATTNATTNAEDFIRLLP